MCKNIDSLARGIQRCQRCERSQTRKHAVPGEGDPGSKMLLVGEAPGKKEDRTGRPFVGQAGDYLEKVLLQHGTDRKQVFTTSVLKCYHPESPQKKQIHTCLPWTRRQIESLDPKLVLVMGRWAAWALLDRENLEGILQSLSRERISWVVTCHPAAAMRFPERDKEFREGFRLFVSKAEDLGL